jgi:hypothetical protein
MKTWHPKTFIVAIILLAFLLLVIPQRSSAHQSQDQSKDALANAAAITKMTSDWMSGKLSSPGVRVEVKEMERSTDGGQLKVQYHVFVKGAPTDQTYAFSAWPINAAGPVEQMKGLSIMPDGTVVCAGRKPGQCGEKEQPDDPVDFTFAPGRGEVFRLSMVSADGKWKIYFAMVPNPIVKTDGSCSLEVIRLTPKFELTLVRAKGFKPGEDLTFTSKSYDESHVNKVKADANGEYQSALLPAVKKHANGTTELQLKGASCAPELSFEWAK